MKKSIQLLTIFAGLLVLFASCDKKDTRKAKGSSEHFMRQKNKQPKDKYQRDSHPMRQMDKCDDDACEKPCKKTNSCRCKSCLNDQQAQDKILNDQAIKESQEEVFATEPVLELNEDQVFDDQNVALEYEEVENSEK